MDYRLHHRATEKLYVLYSSISILHALLTFLSRLLAFVYHKSLLLQSY